MSLSQLVMQWICVILISKTHADTHDCTEDNQCNGENPVICAAGESCTVNCNAYRACYHGKIQCPAGQDCTVNCAPGNQDVCH